MKMKINFEKVELENGIGENGIPYSRLKVIISDKDNLVETFMLSSDEKKILAMKLKYDFTKKEPVDVITDVEFIEICKDKGKFDSKYDYNYTLKFKFGYKKNWDKLDESRFFLLSMLNNGNLNADELSEEENSNLSNLGSVSTKKKQNE